MENDSRIIRYIRIARGIEAGGHYNVAKLLRALAYAEEVQSSNRVGIPRGDELDHEIEALIDDLKGQSANPALLTTLEKGLTAIRTERPLHYEDSPEVYVSRISGDIFIGDPPASTPDGEDRLTIHEVRPYYYLEPVPVPVLLTALRTFPAVVTSALKGLNDAQLKRSPAPGEWSLRELLRHFEVTQGLLHSRVQQYLTEDNPLLRSIPAWTMTESAGMSARDILSRYVDSRVQTMNLLAPLKPEDWWLTAHHDEFGALTLQEHASYFAQHERSHRPQLMGTIRAVSLLQ